MTNTSATGGVLLPDDTVTPAYGDSLDSLLQAYLVALTNLDGKLVRPRWQPTVPKQPEANVDWCAIGITNIKTKPTPAIYQPTTETTRYSIHEEIEILYSFYGPNSQGIASSFRDGLYIPQNNHQLAAFNAAFLRAEKIIPAPEFINQGWIKRHDITVFISRQVIRHYPILSTLTVPSITTTDG